MWSPWSGLLFWGNVHSLYFYHLTSMSWTWWGRLLGVPIVHVANKLRVSVVQSMEWVWWSRKTGSSSSSLQSLVPIVWLAIGFAWPSHRGSTTMKGRVNRPAYNNSFFSQEGWLSYDHQCLSALEISPSATRWGGHSSCTNKEVLVALKCSCFTWMPFVSATLWTWTRGSIFWRHPVQKGFLLARIISNRIGSTGWNVRVTYFDLLLPSGSFWVPTLRPAILFPLGGVARQWLYLLPMFHDLIEPYQIICFRQLLRFQCNIVRMEEGGQGGQPSDQNSSFEVDLDIEKSSDLDVDAEKEKARSRWDEPEDVSHSRDPDEESEKDEGSSRVGTPTLPSSPRSCPPTPEALPQGLRTPPPSTSSSGQAR